MGRNVECQGQVHQGAKEMPKCDLNLLNASYSFACINAGRSCKTQAFLQGTKAVWSKSTRAGTVKNGHVVTKQLNRINSTWMQDCKKPSKTWKTSPQSLAKSPHFLNPSSSCGVGVEQNDGAFPRIRSEFDIIRTGRALDGLTSPSRGVTE